MKHARLWLHIYLWPTHRLVGKSGTPVACGTCLGFTRQEIDRGAVGGSWRVPPPWRVK